MKTFNRYIARSLLTDLSMALGVLTFVMFSAHFFRAFDLLARGGSPLVLLKVLAYLLPDILRFALPLSMLVATVLVFSRMSADNEITALRASGISLWQIVSPGLLISGALSVLCLWISFFVSPECRYQSEQIRWSLMSAGPLAMLEPGVPAALSKDTQLIVRDRHGDLLKDIHLVSYDPRQQILKDVSAEHGMLAPASGNGGGLRLQLRNFALMEWDFRRSGEARQSSLVVSRALDLPLEQGEIQDRKRLSRKLKMMNLKMLFADMLMRREEGLPAGEHLVQLHYRLALSMSPFAFFLLGIPFGIRNRRSETSVGLLICVVLALFFYAFLLLGDCLEKQPRLHPELLLWIPNVLYQLGGLWAIRRIGGR